MILPACRRPANDPSALSYDATSLA